MSESKLKFLPKVGYGFGHVQNDLTATIWFSYTLLFLKDVALIEVAAGPLFMLGQLADAFFTIIIGILIDLYSTKRRWHLFGSFLVAVSFPSIFLLHKEIIPYWMVLIYLSLMIVLFQCGWATVQISHLAVIPQLSSIEKERGELNAIRYGMSVIANITVFIVTFFFIREGEVNIRMNDEIGPHDFNKFRNISLIVTALGIFATIIFYVTVPSLNNKKQECNTLSNLEDGKIEKTKSQMMSVLKTLELYKVAFIYTFSRLFFVICTIYIPIWLNELIKLKIGQHTVESIAIIPLVFFLSSFVATVIVKHISLSVNTLIIYALGSIISILGCVYMAFTINSELNIIELYAIAVLFGVGSSITQISSLNLVSNFIGINSNTSGLVYSIATACDKIFSGIIILIIELIAKSYQYYLGVLIFNGISSILGLIILACLKR